MYLRLPAALHLAPTSYVDAGIVFCPPNSGGTLMGFLTLHVKPTSTLNACSKAYEDSAIAGIPAVDRSSLLPKAGGTMTVSLTLTGAPSRNLPTAMKAYTDSLVGSKFSLLGGTITGYIPANVYCE